MSSSRICMRRTAPTRSGVELLATGSSRIRPRADREGEERGYCGTPKLEAEYRIENSNNPLTNYTVSKFLDHGTANPIVARLTLQTFAILDACDLSKESADKIKVVYMHALMKSLLRCGEIAMGYQSEFVKEMEACKRRPPSAIVTVPSIMRLEEECRNFLYEAKNFIRDTLKAFNLLYGTAFEEASEFLWPKKGRSSLIGFAESTFGPEDDKTKLFKQMLQAVERVVTFRNAVEHPGG